MIKREDVKWFAGFCEGEACFSSWKGQPQLFISQCQRWPLEKCVELVGGKISKPDIDPNPKHKPKFRYWLPIDKAAGWMMMIYEFMSPGRKEAIKKALKDWRAHPPQRKFRTHCQRGHEWNKENTGVSSEGYRQCKACLKIHWKKNRERNWGYVKKIKIFDRQGKLAF